MWERSDVSVSNIGIATKTNATESFGSLTQASVGDTSWPMSLDSQGIISVTGGVPAFNGVLSSDKMSIGI
jgi:hypothetical protein